MTIRPDVGLSSRLMQRTSVDLPAPDSPMMPKISPSSIVRSTSINAWCFDAPSYVLDRCSIWIIVQITSYRITNMICGRTWLRYGRVKLGLSVRAHADEPRLGHAHHHAMYEFEIHNGSILDEALGMSSVKPQFGAIRPDLEPISEAIETAKRPAAGKGIRLIPTPCPPDEP